MNTLTNAINVLTQVQALAASLNISVEALMGNMEKMVKLHNEGMVWIAVSKEEYESRTNTKVEEVELTEAQKAFQVVNGKVVSAEEAEVWFKEFMAVEEEVEVEETIAMNAKATFVSLVQNKKEVEDEEEVISEVVNAIKGNKEEELQEVIDYIIGSDLLGKQQLINEINKYMDVEEVAEEVKADYEEYTTKMHKEEYERKLAKLMEVEEDDTELEIQEDWLFNEDTVNENAKTQEEHQTTDSETKTDEVPWLILD